MQLRLDTPPGIFQIRGYGQGYITVNDRDHGSSLIVTPRRLVTDWPPERFADLEEAHFELILELEPEIVLLGTGARQRFPHPRLTRPLLGRGIGVEVMDTAAACRTYAIVMAEGRRVAAALLMI